MNQSPVVEQAELTPASAVLMIEMVAMLVMLEGFEVLGDCRCELKTGEEKADILEGR
jgi:hypothetical protein